MGVLDKKTGKINQEQDHYRDAEKPPPLPVKKRVRNKSKNRSISKNRIKQKERTAKNVQISTKPPIENTKGMIAVQPVKTLTSKEQMQKQQVGTRKNPRKSSRT